MQGYSSCKQNHLKICYKCAQISSPLVSNSGMYIVWKLSRITDIKHTELSPTSPGPLLPQWNDFIPILLNTYALKGS